MKSQVTLIAVGDIGLKTRGDKPPFSEIKKAFAGKDVLFGNLETVLAYHGTPAEKAVVLVTPPDKAVHLKDAGFDILNIANNHILDMGMEGFQETIKTLRKHGLTYIGAGIVGSDQGWAVVERGPFKLGFVGYCEGEKGFPEEGVFVKRIELPRMLEEIAMLKEMCDFVIVSLHWGIEKVFYPSPRQIALARRCVDVGATVVLGHHPHVIQGIERYKSGLIAYSLGNFQFEFDQQECSKTPSKRTNESFVLRVQLDEGGVRSYEILPVEIGKDWVPRIPVKERRDEIRAFVVAVSEPLQKEGITESWWLEEIAGEYLSENFKSFLIRIRRYGIKHFVQYLRWLVSPFCLKCYMALARRKFKGVLRKT